MKLVEIITYKVNDDNNSSENDENDEDDDNKNIILIHTIWCNELELPWHILNLKKKAIS